MAPLVCGGAMAEGVADDRLVADRGAGQLGLDSAAMHDIDALQSLILTKALGITSADAGSLFLRAWTASTSSGSLRSTSTDSDTPSSAFQ